MVLMNYPLGKWQTVLKEMLDELGKTGARTQDGANPKVP